jgi:hypothetical protein
MPHLLVAELKAVLKMLEDELGVGAAAKPKGEGH